MTSHNQSAFYHRPQYNQGGFTLVELMVGLVIGMLASLVVLQEFSVFEAQKRASTGAADALTNGNIALYKIGRDIQAGAYSLVPLSVTLSPLSCALPITIDASIPPAAGGPPTDIFPVSIVDNLPGTTSDGITLRYATTERGGIPTPIQSLAGNPITIQSNLGCAVGDVSLVMNGTACTVSYVTGLPQLSANSAVLGTVTLANTTNTVNGATLSCLGRWREVTYRVNAGTFNLERRDTLAPAPNTNTFVPLVAGVVNLQAQYGIAATGLPNTAPNFNQIVQWVDATGIWATPTVANRKLIKAVRIAIVARDAKLDPNSVSDVCNQAAQTGLCAWADSASSVAPTIDLAGMGIAKWKQYRYRVFESIVPLRTVNWSKPYL